MPVTNSDFRPSQHYHTSFPRVSTIVLVTCRRILSHGAAGALPVLGMLAVVLLLVDAQPAQATDLCAATGSPFGPFALDTYEAGRVEHRTTYARTLELAGFNQLFPELPTFALPPLETGDRAAGSSQPVSPYIPPVLLKSIAWLESTWNQAAGSVPYGEVGPVLTSHDCGYGLMQVTTGMQNVSGVPNLDQAMIGGHYAFNIARGARILADKWNAAPEYRPIVGARNFQTIEDWYYALWGYNGFAFKNHPLNPDYAFPRPAYDCSSARTYPYQELVLGCAANPPSRDGVQLWSPQPVHLPDLTDLAFAGPLSIENWNPCSQNVQCAPMDMPTPNPANQDPTPLTVTREQVIGSPALGVSSSAVSLIAQPTGVSESTAVTIWNVGTGVLTWRLSTATPWLRLSRLQGVSLGSDLGAESRGFGIWADASSLPPGAYTGQVTIESKYASGAPFTISISLLVLDYSNETLLKGSEPTVFVMQHGLKRDMVSLENFLARGYSLANVIQIPDSWLNAVPTGQPMLDALATGNLLKGSAADVYVMENGRKRHVVNAQVFLGCGYYWDALFHAPDSVLNSIPTGPPLGDGSCPRPLYPDGTLLQGSDTGVWVMSAGAKRWAVNPEIFFSCGYQWGNVNRVADSTLFTISNADQLTACTASGTLLRGSGPAVYIVQYGLKRHVVSLENFLVRGYDWNDVVPVSDSLLNAIPTGNPLLDALATGNLLKGSSADVYAMENGYKRHAVNVDVFLACGYYWDALWLAPDTVLNTIPPGPTLGDGSCPRLAYPDGTLLQGSDTGVWVVSGGTKHWAVSSEVFLSCGYQWGNINRIPVSTLNAIPIGTELSACGP